MSKTTLYQPTDEELKGARKHVLYELRMLHAAASAYLDSAHSRKDPQIGSAFTDSLLLHARNLYKFLTGMPGYNDDMVAGHFVSKNDGTPWTSSKLKLVRSCMSDINKFRSHLTYSRVGPGRDWPRPEIRDEIVDAFHEFIALLPDSEQEHWKT